MTLAEIKTSDKLFLTARDVAEVLAVDPQVLRLQAHKDSSLLGFPVMVAKSRVKIPRVPFLRWMGELP